MTAPEAADPEASSSPQLSRWNSDSPLPSSLRRTPWRLRIEDVGRIATAYYPGSGTVEDPYLVDFLPDDQENAQGFPDAYKWAVTALVSLATMALTFCSTAYSGASGEIMDYFEVPSLVVVLGISFYVLGYALGPLIWAPFSEVFGRRPLFVITYGVQTAFNAGCTLAPSMPSLIVMRFLAGAFGSSSSNNAGATISDMFTANKRGLAMCFYLAAQFALPVMAPIAGGFLGSSAGWRWVMWSMTLFTALPLALGALFHPETYAPAILRDRAERLSAATGAVYRSRYDGKAGSVSLIARLRVSLTRPWVLLLLEPIVLLLSIYMAISYGVLYMLFPAFPVVYQKERGWSPGVGGLAFVSVSVGMLIAVAYAVIDNRRYARLAAACEKGSAPPEARLPPAMVGAVALPVGLFWFAFTNGPEIHWIVSMLAGAPFGFGMVLVLIASTNYLIDAYVIYAASVLAASTVMRCVFGAVFPLFTRDMYSTLGIHWASALPGFLALACLPFPFVFWKYGGSLRKRCKYAAEAAALLEANSMVTTKSQAAMQAPKIVVVADGSSVVLAESSTMAVAESIVNVASDSSIDVAVASDTDDCWNCQAVGSRT